MTTVTPSNSPKTSYQITAKDLPLCCPLSQTPVWNMHPRVYLQFDSNNKATCPYCGAIYTMDTKA